MPHARAQIRHALADLLRGLPTTGDRVYASRTRSLPKDHPPSIAVYSRREPVQVSSTGRPVALDRVVTISVEGWVTASEDVDDVLDQIAAEVERKIGSDPTLGGKAKDGMLTETEIGFDGDGEKPVGLIRMDFAFMYRTRENDPETLIS